MKSVEVDNILLLGTLVDKAKVVKYCSEEQTRVLFEELISYPNWHDSSLPTTPFKIILKQISSGKLNQKQFDIIFNYAIEAKTHQRSLNSHLMAVLECFDVVKNYIKPMHLEILKDYAANNLSNVSIIKILNSKFSKKINLRDMYLKKMAQAKDYSSVELLATSLYSSLGINKNQKEEFLKAYQLGLKNVPTKVLLANYKTKKYTNYSYYDDLDSVSWDIKLWTNEVFKRELDSREHVLKKSQSKIIRQMSIHAGEKLTLAQAQSLAHKLKNKKKD